MGRHILKIPMHTPVEMRRRVAMAGAPGRGTRDVVVARGPLVIMAHGLCAIAPDMRDSFRITSAAGDLDAREVEEMLRAWSVAAARPDEG